MRRIFLALCLAWPAVCGDAGVLHLTAFDKDGRSMSAQDLLNFIARQDQKNHASPEASGLYVTDLSGNPVDGRPWWTAVSKQPAVAWTGAIRIKLSLPWPVEKDGFSTVFLDKEGVGYADGETLNLNEAIAVTQYRLFREALQNRTSAWNPAYKPTGDFERLRGKAEEAMRAALAASDPAKRARLFDKALTTVSLAWEKLLFQHGGQIARDPKLGPSLRWGLTLDDSLANRLADLDRILKSLEESHADWVRLVFRLNPDDFTYAHPRSFNEYDPIVDALSRRKIRIMASVLDSSLWPSTLTADALKSRTQGLVFHYKDKIRSWEVASESNGNCLGGCRAPIRDDVVVAAIKSAAAEIKRIDPSLETVATLYWWEGTAGDDRHATFTWLKHAMGLGAFEKIDVMALSVYPNDNPMGLAFDPVFSALGQYFPGKRLMLGGFGYVDREPLRGYWWLNPDDAEGARKDLIILYTGAAAAVPRSIGGGFWWNTLGQMLDPNGRPTEYLKIYRRTLRQMDR